jgi:hypothetical protein
MIHSRPDRQPGPDAVGEHPEYRSVGLDDVAGACSGERTPSDAIAERLKDSDPSIRREFLIYFAHSDMATPERIADMIDDDDAEIACLAAYLYMGINGDDASVLRRISGMGGSSLRQIASERLANVGCGE